MKYHKVRKRRDLRREQFDNTPINERQGYNRPGSLNGHKQGPRVGKLKRK